MAAPSDDSIFDLLPSTQFFDLLRPDSDEDLDEKIAQLVEAIANMPIVYTPMSGESRKPGMWAGRETLGRHNPLDAKHAKSLEHAIDVLSKRMVDKEAVDLVGDGANLQPYRGYSPLTDVQYYMSGLSGVAWMVQTESLRQIAEQTQTPDFTQMMAQLAKNSQPSK